MQKLFIHISLVPFVLFSVLAVCGQSLDDLNQWKIIDINDFDPCINLEEISHLESYANIVENAISQSLEHTNSHFREADFNSDGKLDVFYNGNIGGEGDYLIVWQKLDAGYEQVFRASGKLLRLWKSENDGLLGISLLSCGCCGDENCTFEVYKPEESAGILRYSLEMKNSLLGYTEVPDTINETLRFRTINNNYTLRGSPEINDTFPEEAPSRPAGNILCKIKKGTQGVKLAEKTDDTGRVWWFVALEIDGMKDSYFHNGDNEGESSHVLGWLSSRYIEIINP